MRDARTATLLAELATSFETCERERDEANAVADRLDRENNGMCDDITILRERIEKLEEALKCFAMPALTIGDAHQRIARAALMGMSPGDPAVDRAWLARQRGRAA